MASKGLGPRGKDALFSSSIQTQEESDIFKEIPTFSLNPCAGQPRKKFNEEHLKELADSIKEKGIVQPLVVRKINEGKYEIVAGERRWRAAKILGLQNVPVIIRNYSDIEVMTIALVENIQRENLNPMEEAEAFAILKEKYELSQEELAKSLGKSRPTVANALRLLNLPEDIRKLIFDGNLSGAHGRTLLALKNQELIPTVATRIQEQTLSVRDTENIIEYVNTYHKLPENSNSSNTLENLENKEGKTKRRKLSKSQAFKDIQKILRNQLHRGISVTGTLENGKISLPFAGQAELLHVLKLLSSDSILKDVEITEDFSEDGFEHLDNVDPTPLIGFNEIGGNERGLDGQENIEAKNIIAVLSDNFPQENPTKQNLNPEEID